MRWHDHQVTDPQQFRIGNNERDAALTALGNHMRAGRLSPDEYSTRASQATNAVTRTDLDVLFADLPGGGVIQPASSAGGSGYPSAAPAFPAVDDSVGAATGQPAGSPSAAHGTGYNWLTIAGPAALVLFFVCGFAFHGFGWSWLFFLLPGLLAAGTRGRR